MNGLWTAEFGSSTGIFGGGVVVFKDGTLMGGDAGYFYLGDYTLTGNTLQAKLTITPFIQGYQSVFGTADRILTMNVAGILTDETHVIGQGHPDGMPALKFGVKLTKRV